MLRVRWLIWVPGRGSQDSVIDSAWFGRVRLDTVGE